MWSRRSCGFRPHSVHGRVTTYREVCPLVGVEGHRDQGAQTSPLLATFSKAGGRIYTGGFWSRARCGRRGLQTAPWTPRLGGIRALLRWHGHTPSLGSPAARNLARAGVGESRSRSSDPGPAAGVREGGRETDGVSSGGILSSGARSLGWLVESRNRTPHSSKAGACGGERGWGGERSANYVPRRLLPLVVSQLSVKAREPQSTGPLDLGVQE